MQRTIEEIAMQILKSLEFIVQNLKNIWRWSDLWKNLTSSR